MKRARIPTGCRLSCARSRRGSRRSGARAWRASDTTQSRNVALAGHGEGGAADAGKQREQHAERGERRPRRARRASSASKRPRFHRRGERAPSPRPGRPARETISSRADDQRVDQQRDRRARAVWRAGSCAAGSTTSSPSVAIRAYPAKAKNSSAAPSSRPSPPGGPAVRQGAPECRGPSIPAPTAPVTASVAITTTTSNGRHARGLLHTERRSRS